MRLLIVAALFVATAALGADKTDHTATIGRIADEGLNHSELPELASHLTDRIGGRMTNSPQMRAAEKWAQEQFRRWGLQNVRADGFEFGRGWSIERIEMRMVTPRVLTLRAIPIAWTPSTNGTITAPVIVAPLRRETDLEKWRGKLKGKIVLIDLPTNGSEPDKAAFSRLSNEDLHKLDEFEQPQHAEVRIARFLKRVAFEAKRDAFLAAEGALASVNESRRDGGLLHGEGYGYQVGQTPQVPSVEIAAEDYRKLARLAKSEQPPTVELTSTVKYHDEDTKAYNILADIPGRDAKAGYVMAGAHLDSWVAADGAQDNAAGSVAIMEAARILAALGVKPKRTIRFALWSAEEQTLGGSLAYAEKYLASRPPVTDPELAKLFPDATWDLRWPITPLPGHKDLVAYFNVDNGSGKIRGIHTENNLAVAPIFREWLQPFTTMGATQVVSQPTGGTDHVPLDSVGIPAFQFIQDPLDYGSRIHHTSIDSYDHLKIADLKQVAVILAAFLLQAADRDEPLPRVPLDRKPKETDPFSYEDIDDEVRY
jgi:carboxypeptidase Q